MNRYPYLIVLAATEDGAQKDALCEANDRLEMLRVPHLCGDLDAQAIETQFVHALAQAVESTVGQGKSIRCPYAEGDWDGTRKSALPALQEALRGKVVMSTIQAGWGGVVFS